MSVLSIFVAWLSYTLCLWLCALVLPGFEVKEGIKGAAAAAIVLGILNALAVWMVFDVFNLDVLWHLGGFVNTLLRWLITALLLLVTDKVSGAVSIRNFGMAFLTAVAVTVGSGLLSPLLFSLLHQRF